MTLSGAALPPAWSVDRAGQDGSSPITSLFGVMVFLTFLLFAVQVVLYLFTASIVQAAAVDGASYGAGAAQVASADAATTRARAVLGRLGAEADIVPALRTDASGEVLHVTISVDLPTLLGGTGLSTIERSAQARIER